MEPGGRVLDLGCGVGRHTVHLAQMGLRVVGGDISPSGLAACTAQLGERGLLPVLTQHDMGRLPFATDVFDGLLAFHVIYHTTLDGLRVVLSEIRRVLRPRSHLYLTFLGRVEENISRYRADVARGICQEVEPFTFVYLREAPGDKDLPHHYCDEAELRDLLAAFEIETVLPVRDAYTDEHGARHVSLHYHVQARRQSECSEQSKACHFGARNHHQGGVHV